MEKAKQFFPIDKLIKIKTNIGAKLSSSKVNSKIKFCTNCVTNYYNCIYLNLYKTHIYFICILIYCKVVSLQNNYYNKH